MADQLTLYSVHGLYSPKTKRGNDQRRQKESDASRLPLLKATLCDALLLVHLGGVVGGLEGVAGLGQRLEVDAVMLVGLYMILAEFSIVINGSTHTKGTPQYPQVAISGLSVLMKILG
jgi:hypothetical protein